MEMTIKGKAETKSQLIPEQKNEITNYAKAEIDNMQKSKCRQKDDRDETDNHIISEYSKLAQKEYKSNHG